MPTLADVARVAGADLPDGADPGRSINGFAALEDAGPADLSAVGHERAVKLFRRSRAGAVLASDRLKLPRDADGDAILLRVPDAELAFAAVVDAFGPATPHPPAGVHPSAVVDESADVDPTAAVGPNAVVGHGAVVGPNCRLHAGVVVGQGCRLGAGCVLFPNVVLRERVTLGQRVVVHAGSVIGSDGFGYRWNGTEHRKIPQVGTVEVGDDCEIGSCVCVDRAKLSATRIGPGTKIDNLVQIGHNAQIGPRCIIVGQSGVAGSATLGEGVAVGGQVAIRDHVTLADGASVAARGAVADDVAPGRTVGGTPAMPQRQYLREQAALRRLPELLVQVRKLQDEVDRLRADRGNS